MELGELQEILQTLFEDEDISFSEITNYQMILNVDNYGTSVSNIIDNINDIDINKNDRTIQLTVSLY